MQKDFIYENYLKMPDDLEFEQAMKVYEELLEENLEEDEIYDKLWDHALHCMIDYGSLRAHWQHIQKSMAKKQNGEMNLDIKEKESEILHVMFL